jgi:hypothetical protein
MSPCRLAAMHLLLSLTFAGLAMPSPSLAGSPPPADPDAIEPFPYAPVAEGPAPAAAAHVALPRATAVPDAAWTTDWASLIDARWGPSPLTSAQMLTIFDTFWANNDQQFACFQGIDVNWTALRDQYRPEVALGPSRGRFAGIMNHLARALRESHTRAVDRVVANSPLAPGTPLMVVGGWGNNAHFGAGLTPLPDSSLLVYKVIPNHPLGLRSGDIVLGYDGVRWADLYPSLLEAQLPLMGWWWGSSPSSYDHSFLMAAGMNWHLFDTIDVVRHATGDTVHLATAPLAGLATPLDCTEQLPVPGVPVMDWTVRADTVSWGVVRGTNVGYVYARAWSGSAGTRFYNAIDSLTRVIPTSGLILDFRTNYGGSMFLAYPALQRLFNHDVGTIGFAYRCSATDHLGMCPAGSTGLYVIHGIASGYYDKPIAVLVGPGAVSSGDQVAHLFKFRPNTRLFGKSTSTAFNSPTTYSLGTDWYALLANADAYRLNAPGDYLTHDELAVDEPVWLTPDDVASGFDTVVGAALGWLGVTAVEQEGAHGATTASPNPFAQSTSLRFAMPETGAARLVVYDVAGRRVRSLADDETLPAGWHVRTWDARDEQGRLVAPGLYLARLTTPAGTSVRRMIRVQ